MKLHAYITALCAMKFDPEHITQVKREGDNVRFTSTARIDRQQETSSLQPIEIGQSVILVLASTLEAAETLGVGQAREKWPEVDGWVGHTATPRGVSKALLIDTVERISEDPSGDEASEMSSDLVM